MANMIPAQSEQRPRGPATYFGAAGEPVQFPEVSKALIDELERMYPDRMPTKPLSAEEMTLQIGRLQIVRFLREQFNRQQEVEKD